MICTRGVNVHEEKENGITDREAANSSTYLFVHFQFWVYKQTRCTVKKKPPPLNTGIGTTQ